MTNAPLRVPTRTRTLDMHDSFFFGLVFSIYQVALAWHFLVSSMPLFTAQRQQRLQPTIAQVRPQPNQHAGKHGWNEVVTDAYVRGDRTSKVAGQQNGSQDRSPQNHVNDNAGQLHNADADRQPLGITEPPKLRQDLGWLHQLHDAAEDEHQHNHGGDN